MYRLYIEEVYSGTPPIRTMVGPIASVLIREVSTFQGVFIRTLSRDHNYICGTYAFPIPALTCRPARVVHAHAVHPAPPIDRPGTGARESTCQ